jgi:hypothetical protein
MPRDSVRCSRADCYRITWSTGSVVAAAVAPPDERAAPAGMGPALGVTRATSQRRRREFSCHGCERSTVNAAAVRQTPANVFRAPSAGMKRLCSCSLKI